MILGRQHSTEYSHLPKGMYYNKKGKTYYLRVPGQKDKRLGKSLHAALSAYYQQSGIYFGAETVKDLIVRYMQEVSPTKSESTHKTNQGRAKKLLLAFSDFRPAELRTYHIQQYLTAQKDTPVDANRAIALLSSVFSEAIRWGVIDESPCVGIKYHREVPRTRLVTDNEVAVFKTFAPNWMINYIDLKLATALRQTDMLSLNSGIWDEQTGLWVETSKTGEKLRFEPTDNLKRIIFNIRKSSRSAYSGNVSELKWWFFPNQKGKPYTADGFRTMWHKTMKKALASGELQERFREQDLRAKAATACDSLMEAYELCGHRNISTTRRIYRRGYTSIKPLQVKKVRLK